MSKKHPFIPHGLKTIVLVFCLAILPQIGKSQDCNFPSNVCYSDPYYGEEVTSYDSLPFTCFGTDSVYVSYYSFTTNSEGGEITVSIFNQQCLGNDKEITTAIFSTSGDVCDVTTWNQTSNCQTGIGEITVESDTLQAATEYYVAVAIKNYDPILDTCFFSVEIYGEAVRVRAGNEISLSLGDTIELEGIGGENYSWSPDYNIDGVNESIPKAWPMETTTYTLTSTVGDCTMSDDVLVKLKPAIIPNNTITPNGDMYNDTWVISGMSRYPQSQLTIFDRWGQVMFKYSGYTDQWDGTRNGHALPAGTYYYIIQLNISGATAKQNTFSGWVSIVR